ncbi:hypothetical protein D3C71_1533320 [compost metagenome]
MPPRRTLPSGETIRNRHSSTKMLAAPIKNQARLLVSQLRMALNSGSTSACRARVRTTNRRMVSAEILNTLPWISRLKRNLPWMLS